MVKAKKKTLQQARDERQYIELASKICKWEIDVNEKIIFVPHTLEAEALEDITVRHLVKDKGCKIELTIDEEPPAKKLFDPQLRARIIRAPVTNYPYNVGEAFTIVNSGFEVEISEVVLGSKGGLNFWFEYNNRDAERFKMYATDIKRLLDFALWIRVKK